MGNQEPLALQGYTVLQAKLGTLGEMGFQAFEENMALLGPLALLEHRESQATTANPA